MKVKKIMSLLYELYRDINGIGFILAIQKNFYRIKKIIGKDKKIYMKFIYSYVLKKVSPVIDKYKNLKMDEIDLSDNRIVKIPVWVCWWQGQDEMPPIIKCCLDSLKESIPKDICEVHLVTLKNYKKYVDFPQYIIDKINSGKITYTHFSDILRFSLLSKYGGLWVDSTIYFSKPLSKDIFKMSLFTHRRIDLNSVNISNANWATYIIGGKKNHLLFQYLEEVLLDYWKKYNSVIDYYILDYIIATAYNEIEYINNEINKIPYNNPNIFSLNKCMNESYNNEIFDEISSDTNIYKLSRKESYDAITIDGEETFYGHLLKNKRKG